MHTDEIWQDLEDTEPTQLLNVTLNVSHIEDHQVLKYQSSGLFTYIFT